jgi:LytS/YehU family sensor histidine kinase
MITGVIIYWILYARFQHQKKKDDEKAHLTRQIADLKIQSLQAQMNPHFIFNILNSIQSLILQTKTKDALQYLSSLGSIIRMNLENVSEEYIPFEEEIRFLKKYIEIEELRFKKKFQIELKNDIPEVNILVPPMLIQPIIENAIKHGVRGLNDGGLVTVSFNVENERLAITVEDNGIGRMASNKTKIEHHQSKGQELIERRLNLLNEKNKTTANSISITDLEENGQASGTKVIVTLELIWAT